MKPCNSSLLILLLSALGTIESASVSGSSALVSSEAGQMATIQEPLLEVLEQEPLVEEQVAEAQAEEDVVVEQAEEESSVHLDVEEQAEAIEEFKEEAAIKQAEAPVVSENAAEEQEEIVATEDKQEVLQSEEEQSDSVSEDQDSEETIDQDGEIIDAKFEQNGAVAEVESVEAVEAVEEEHIEQEQQDHQQFEPQFEKRFEQQFDQQFDQEDQFAQTFHPAESYNASEQQVNEFAAVTPFSFPDNGENHNLQKSAHFGAQGGDNEQWFDASSDGEDYFAPRQHASHSIEGKGAFHQEALRTPKHLQQQQQTRNLQKMSPRRPNTVAPRKVLKKQSVSYQSSSTNSDAIDLGLCQAATLGFIASLRVIGMNYPLQANSLERQKFAQFLVVAVNGFPCPSEQKLMRQAMVMSPPIFSDRKRFNKWVDAFSKKMVVAMNCPVDLNLDDIIVPRR